MLADGRLVAVGCLVLLGARKRKRERERESASMVVVVDVVVVVVVVGVAVNRLRFRTIGLPISRARAALSGAETPRRYALSGRHLRSWRLAKLEGDRETDSRLIPQY